MTDILDPMGLVNQWLQFIQSRGLSNSAGLRELNNDLGTSYRDNALYQWRNGMNPQKHVLDYMRQCVTRSVLEQRLGIEIHPKTAKSIADDLS